MAKAPAIQFYVRDWTTDCSGLSVAAKGAWIQMLCQLHLAARQGELTKTPEAWARVCGCNTDQFNKLLEELASENVADIERAIDENETPSITISCRRIVRERQARTGGAERQQRFRDRGGGDPERWTAIRATILERDAKMCAYCGRRANTVDHVIPKLQGGDESASNLVACCKRCNSSKKNRTPQDAGMSFWPGFDQSKLESNIKVTPPSASAVSASASATAKEAPPMPPSDAPLEVGGIGPPPDRQPAVEMSEAAQILTNLIDQWNATKGKRRLCLASGETLEIGIRQKIIERGIPILEIPKFDLKLVEASVGEWRQHCKQLRTSKGRTTRTPSWGLGYLANAWFAQDAKQHDTNAKGEAAQAEANETARGLLRTKEAEDDNAAKLAAWGKLQPREQNRILKAHKAKHGALSVKPAAIAEWWQQQKGQGHG